MRPAYGMTGRLQTRQRHHCHLRRARSQILLFDIQGDQRQVKPITGLMLSWRMMSVGDRLRRGRIYHSSTVGRRDNGLAACARDVPLVESRFRRSLIQHEKEKNQNDPVTSRVSFI